MSKKETFVGNLRMLVNKLNVSQIKIRSAYVKFPQPLPRNDQTTSQNPPTFHDDRATIQSTELLKKKLIS